MKTNVYVVEDEDVLDSFFGPESKPLPVASLAEDHGELVYSEDMPIIPETGDVILLDTEDGIDEYIVICRLFQPEKSCCNLICHPRLFIEMETASS